MNKNGRILAAMVIVVLLFMVIGISALARISRSDISSKKNIFPTQTTKPAVTSSVINEVTSSTALGSEIPVDTSQSFSQQVELVCNSVDSHVFTDLLSINPKEDTTYKSKFELAVNEIGRLRRGFEKVNVPTQHTARWQLGLDNLRELERLVGLVSDQYSEYLALADELESSKDLGRSIQIIQRQFTLVGEYLNTLNDINNLYNELLSIGTTAGVSKCAAFTPAT